MDSLAHKMDALEIQMAKLNTQFPLKKTGDRRVVMNFKPVNSVTVKLQWPTHNRQMIFHTLIQGNHGVFFQGDAAHGYWAIPTRFEHQGRAAFIANSPIIRTVIQSKLKPIHHKLQESKTGLTGRQS
ncbi:hypothetical protein F4818DRAFT_428574 [Hypoxylon cercidicola]|nr:hypothetical protein F4818DRAFT_428574 [Hypoxylon cercidicola]